MNDGTTATLDLPRSQLAPQPGVTLFERDAWRSPDGYLVSLDPDDPTHYIVTGNGRTTLRRRVPTQAIDPADQVIHDIVEALGFGDDMPDPDGLGTSGFRMWVEDACAKAQIEYDQRADEHERQLADDGWIVASDITPEHVEFLSGWDPYISIGHQSLIAGDPGVGKSTLALAIAAHVSRLGRNVVILSVEDDPKTKLRPMLEKLGADLSRCVLQPIEKAQVLNADGLAKLDRALATFDPLLVVIDPVTYFLGGDKDMHRANEVRSVMAELSARAAKHRISIVPLMHLNKGGGKALYRILGSIDFPAVARSAMLVGKVDHEPERGRALFHVKCNNGEIGQPRGFDLIREPADPYRLPRFEWRDTDLTEDDVTAAPTPGRKPTQRKTAQSIITALLKNGPVEAQIVKDAVMGAGISETTLRRARDELVEIEQQPLGPAGGSESVWRLKPVASSEPIDPEQEAWLAGLAEEQ